MMSLLPKVGSGYSPLKSQQGSRAAGKKGLLYFGGWQGKGRGGLMSKGGHPPLPLSGQELLQVEGGDSCRNITVNSDSHLEISHQWFDQRHPDCFKYR